MLSSNHRRAQGLIAWLMAVTIFAWPLAAFAQTRIVAPSNKYSVRDDVQAGQEAARQVESQMPILRDGEVDRYIENIGRRLVSNIPSEFQHPEFRYTFKVVNARDINAFALPGGPLYVNRGMIEAARTEGEIAGVMAHEISHIALRHGTAQATKAQKYQWGAIAGAIAGAVIGGPVGSVVSQGTQLGVGAYFLKFSREYETQADILGAQIMARAGYDPRDLANMFQTIERQGGGSSGPEWLSDHPNPGNRYQRIMQEAAALRVSPSNYQDSVAFTRVKQRLRSMGTAPTMAEIARSGQRYPSNGEGNSYPSSGNYPSGAVGERVGYPSSRYRTYTVGNLFRVSVPENWRELSDNSNSVWYAPEGAYGQTQGQPVFTHGVNFGVVQAQSNNLRQATDQFIRSLIQGNPNMRQQSGYQRGNIAGREGLAMTLTNVNEATGRREIVTVYTTQLRNGGLFYMIAVAPQDEYRNYQGAFQNILRSIQLND
jgi:Zn-dependent protease with chaperone function